MDPDPRSDPRTVESEFMRPIVLSDRAGMGYELNLDALAKTHVK